MAIFSFIIHQFSIHSPLIPTATADTRCVKNAFVEKHKSATFGSFVLILVVSVSTALSLPAPVYHFHYDILPAKRAVDKGEVRRTTTLLRLETPKNLQIYWLEIMWCHHFWFERRDLELD